MRYEKLAEHGLRQESQDKINIHSLLSCRRRPAAGNNREGSRGEYFPGFSPVQTSLVKITCFTAAMLLIFISGCTNLTYVKPSSSSTPPESQMLQTNLYGRLDNWQPVGFEAKPFASLIQHSFCEEGGDFDPDVSGDGKWIVFSSLRHSPNPDIYIKRTSGSTATRLTSDPASEIQPNFSPSGDKVAYASNRSGNWDIWVIGVDGTNPVCLTNGNSNDIHPSWSPDGKYIVYCSFGSRSNQWELWIVDTANPSVKKYIGYGLFPEWSPNPKVSKIAYQQGRYRGSQWFSIWTLDMVDGEAKFPTEIISSVSHACICPTWSPDASKIAYSTVGGSSYEKAVPEAVVGSTGEDVWVIDIDGRNNLRLTQGDASNFSPNWSPDGRIFFCSDRKGIENIWSIKPNQVDFVAEKPIDLTRHPQGPVQAN